MYRETVCFLLPVNVSGSVFLAIHKAAVVRHLTAGSQGLNILCHRRNANEMILHSTYFNCQTTLNFPPGLKKKKKIKQIAFVHHRVCSCRSWVAGKTSASGVEGSRPGPFPVLYSVWCQCLSSPPPPPPANGLEDAEWRCLWLSEKHRDVLLDLS